MYGVLKNAACTLPPAERQTWMGHVCGVCLGLRNQFGQISRLLTNYDSALMISLYEAQSDRAIAKRKCQCLLRRPVTALVDNPDEPAARYAAGLALLIASHKIRDNLLDDANWLRGLRRLLASQAASWQRKAHAWLGELGFDASCVEIEFDRQSDIEKLGGREFEFYSQPTELAVGAVFSHTAALAQKPSNAPALFEIGRKFGRIMLLLDAYQDFASDSAARRFNALAAAYPEGDWRQPARALFHQSFSTMQKEFSSLELAQPALLHRLLGKHLRQVGRRSLGFGCVAHPQQAELVGTAMMNFPVTTLFEDNPGNNEEPTIGGDPFPPGNRLCNCRDCTSCLDRPKSKRDSRSAGRECYPNYCYGCDNCCYCCDRDCCCENLFCHPGNWDLSHCGNLLHCENLPHPDCSGCDLSHCDLSGCDCSHCDCNHCDCSHCDCSGCDCNNCDCTNVDCNGCDCNC